uniref:ribonucleoside-diphosphate reductase n=1 Tax=Sicyonia whispovirus TaxID=2984283 RepID=A0A9C7EZ49_9VIRU|nr:MAG: wsv188-like protein [Sicyonia whispovirus]
MSFDALAIPANQVSISASATASADEPKVEKGMELGLELPKSLAAKSENKLYNKFGISVKSAHESLMRVLHAEQLSRIETGEGLITADQKKFATNIFSGLIVDLFRQAESHEHLLTRDNPNRYLPRPIHHNKIFEMTAKAISSFWTSADIDFSQEAESWQTLTTSEKKLFSGILSFFAVFDGLVIENLAARLLCEAELSEARMFFAFQGAVEAIHADVYGLLIESIFRDELERAVVLRNALENPLLVEKMKWARKWIESDDISLNIVAFAIVEGIFFSGAFAAIFWLDSVKKGCKKRCLDAMTTSNVFIAKDEGLHRDFACLLVRERYVKTPDCKRVFEMVREAVDIEKRFFQEVLPEPLGAGMDNKKMGEYIEFVSDKLLEQMNFPTLYRTPNPFSFMANISLENKTNFFERAVGEYELPGVMGYESGKLEGNEEDDLDF